MSDSKSKIYVSKKSVKVHVDESDDDLEEEVEVIPVDNANKVLDPLEDMVTITSSSDKLDATLLNGKITVKLYQHQLESVQRMMDIEDNKHTNGYFFNTGYLILIGIEIVGYIKVIVFY